MKLVLQEQDNYILRFDPQEELIEGIKNFVRKRRLRGGVILCLGSVSEILISYYDKKKREYNDKLIREDLELLSGVGNFALGGKNITVHMHGVFSDSKMQTIGGHIKVAVVNATTEVYLKSFSSRMKRKFNAKLSLNLLD